MTKKINIISLFSGILFSIGLGISGMMNTNKVQGFLDITGKWDPSLIFVIGGGLLVTFIAFPLVFKKEKPIYHDKFVVPTNKKIDKELVIGAFLFGAGWGIGGLCPGPALANLGTFNPNILVFVIFMLTGFFIQKSLSSYLSNNQANNQVLSVESRTLTKETK